VTAPETIGERIRRLRLERRLSQRALAAPGVSYAYLSRIEAGQRRPSPRAIRILATALGVAPELIESGRQVPFANEREARMRDAELALRLDRGLAEAEEVFRAEAERGDEPALEARARAGLGLLASTRGDHAEVIAQLEPALASGYFPPEVRPDLYRALGVGYSAGGMTGRAVALFARSLAELRERAPYDRALRVRFEVYLATAYSALGNLDEAGRHLQEASRQLDRRTSPEVRVNLFWALARHTASSGDTEVALGHMRRVIDLLDATEDTYNLGVAHLFSGQLLAHERRGSEADAHLAEAERLLARRGESGDVGLLRAEQATRAAESGQAEVALALAREAHRLVAGDARYRGAMLHALGAAHAAAGQQKDADRYFAEALELLSARRQWREAARTARAWAELVRKEPKPV
jgi:transcriptional regulator with XRE-family HTH domain